MTITAQDILTTQGKFPDRAKGIKPDSEIYKNATDLAERLSRLEVSLGKLPFVMSSGYRTAQANSAAGGAANSHHLSGRAADFVDNDGELALFCLCNEDLLVHFGLWFEHPLYTRRRGPSGKWAVRWLHLQSKAPVSGTRMFRPAGPMPK